MPRPSIEPHELIAFISSTYIDLKPYRDRVEESLTRIQASFRSMKYFGSKEGDPLDFCLTKVRQCNYYIGVIGHRYGHIHGGERKSITELEYEEAKRLEMSRRIYIATDDVEVKPGHVETDVKRRLLAAFKKRLQGENTVAWFSSPEDLAVKVLEDIVTGLPQKSEIAAYACGKYLPAVRNACASISFLGLDIRSMKRHKDVKLERVYVKNRFGSIASSGKSQVPLEPDFQRQLFEERRTTGQGALTLGALLLAGDNLVVLGDPGSGKTTLAKYLVVSLADKAKQAPAVSNEGIPMRVPLRIYGEYREQSGGVGVSILDFLRRFAKTESQLDSIPDGFFEFYLERKKAILIFDGLDEIFNSHLREQVKNDVVTFTQTAYPGNKVLVTSRKFGYEEAAFPEPEFGHFQILPFDRTQIAEYVNKWYRLEETDLRKRKEEMAGFERASQALPQELLTNPLLLSLIVILFRSGCSLPESKLEIYRSCVGTLTEKWDAAGKRLELPAEYNLVRDKKAAFARIAYWMYKQLSNDGPGQSGLKYNQIVGELNRFLGEREFSGRREEAYQAAEFFLEYAAKRSVFVEDRFSHKTFHEYFAALYLFSTFCLGRTVQELFDEIEPYLSSDNWAVAVELLLLMIDEQAAPLVETIFEKIVDRVRSSPDQSSGLLLVPLRTVGELQNVVPGSVSPLIGAAVAFCVRPQSVQAPQGKGQEEAPHQRVYRVLTELPTRYFEVVATKLRELARSATDTLDLVRIGAFCVEGGPTGWPRVEETLPQWDSARRDLTKRHMGLFYYSTRDCSVADRLRTFVSLYGRGRLFKNSSLIYNPRALYSSVANFTVFRLQILAEEESYRDQIHELLEWDVADYLLASLISAEPQAPTFTPHAEGALRHLLVGGDDPRTYLLDWIVLGRLIRHRLDYSGREGKSAVRRLRRVSATRAGPRAFYASLLLGSDPREVSTRDLGLPRDLLSGLLKATAAGRKARKARRTVSS